MSTPLQMRVDKKASPSGRVTLVGAGPGAPELLTVKAIRALRAADIILFDSLVSEEVLDFAKKDVKRLLVGKRVHRPSCRQGDINALMTVLARQDKNVVRLKSGDPSMFGRAGEEIEVLQKAGIPVTVIPGVTAASSMAATLLVSLTHRKCAHSVRFVTGHSRDGCLPDNVDWNGLADEETTLVVYMGGRTGPAYANRLIAAGIPGSTPCVVVYSTSRQQEECHSGTLAGLKSGLLGSESGAPVLIGIGRVFAQAVAQNTASQNEKMHA